MEWAILALGATRLTILITRDNIMDPFRSLIFNRSDPDTGILGGIVDCPDCCGVWVALFTFSVYSIDPATTINVFTVLAIALVASFIARKGGYA